MEKVVHAFSRENFDLVMLSLPNYGENDLLIHPDEIESELKVYMDNTKKYKRGETERVVYEKVNGLR